MCRPMLWQAHWTFPLEPQSTLSGISGLCEFRLKYSGLLLCVVLCLNRLNTNDSKERAVSVFSVGASNARLLINSTNALEDETIGPRSQSHPWSERSYGAQYGPMSGQHHGPFQGPTEKPGQEWGGGGERKEVRVSPFDRTFLRSCRVPSPSQGEIILAAHVKAGTRPLSLPWSCPRVWISWPGYWCH
jgi:hypothetical protein